MSADFIDQFVDYSGRSIVFYKVYIALCSRHLRHITLKASTFGNLLTNISLPKHLIPIGQVPSY